MVFGFGSGFVGSGRFFFGFGCFLWTWFRFSSDLDGFSSDQVLIFLRIGFFRDQVFSTGSGFRDFGFFSGFGFKV